MMDSSFKVPVGDEGLICMIVSTYVAMERKSRSLSFKTSVKCIIVGDGKTNILYRSYW